jgi:hypothetical protein
MKYQFGRFGRFDRFALALFVLAGSIMAVSQQPGASEPAKATTATTPQTTPVPATAGNAATPATAAQTPTVAAQTPAAPATDEAAKAAAPAAASDAPKQLSGSEVRDAELAANTARLYRLANELKAELEKSGKDTLSLSVMKKADEIEQLARKIKAQMKANLGD